MEHWLYAGLKITVHFRRLKLFRACFSTTMELNSTPNKKITRKVTSRRFKLQCYKVLWIKNENLIEQRIHFIYDGLRWKSQSKNFTYPNHKIYHFLSACYESCYLLCILLELSLIESWGLGKGYRNKWHNLWAPRAGCVLTALEVEVLNDVICCLGDRHCVK